MSGHGSAARRFVLICGYRARHPTRSCLAWQADASKARRAGLCKSACPVAPADLSAFGGWYWGVPKIFKQQPQNSKIMTIIYLINHSTSKLFNEV
jgi:hypothetical protein